MSHTKNSRQMFWLLLMASLIAASCASEGATDAGDAAADTPSEVTDAPDGTAADATDAPAATAAPGATEDPVTTTTAGEEPAADDTAFDFTPVDPVVQDFIAAHDLNGAGLIVVSADEGVIHHQHWGQFDEDRVSLIASSSKMITASVLLRLQDDGLLDINAPVADVASWGEGNPTITPAQLLSNSSGLVGLAPNPAYAPYLCQYGTAGTMQECGEAIFTTSGDDEDIASPDSEFRYGGAQWQVAGAVAEVASGKSWDEMLNEFLIEPCGLETLGYNNHFAKYAGFSYPAAFTGPSELEPTANPNMEGGAFITTGDYGKLLLMHLRGGMCGDTQVLSPEALATMHSDRIAGAYDGDAFGEDTGYGMGWWVDREEDYISDGGAYGSVPWLDLEDGYGAYLVIEATSTLGGELSNELQPVVEQIVTG